MERSLPPESEILGHDRMGSAYDDSNKALVGVPPMIGDLRVAVCEAWPSEDIDVNYFERLDVFDYPDGTQKPKWIKI